MKFIHKLSLVLLVTILGSNASAQTNLAAAAITTKTTIQGYTECINAIPSGLDRGMYKDMVKNCKDAARDESNRSKSVAKSASNEHRPQIVSGGYGYGAPYGYGSSYSSYGYGYRAGTYNMGSSRGQTVTSSPATYKTAPSTAPTVR